MILFNLNLSLAWWDNLAYKISNSLVRCMARTTQIPGELDGKKKNE